MRIGEGEKQNGHVRRLVLVEGPKLALRGRKKVFMQLAR